MNLKKRKEILKTAGQGNKKTSPNFEEVSCDISMYFLLTTDLP